MIYPDDSNEFSEIMDASWQSLSRSTVPERRTKQYWFGQLQEFALGDVANAFDNYIMSAPRMNNGTLILPAVKDIISLCKPKQQFTQIGKAPLSHEENKAHAAKMREAMKGFELGRKDKSWAHNILNNLDKYPHPKSEQYARKALGMEAKA